MKNLLQLIFILCMPMVLVGCAALEGLGILCGREAYTVTTNDVGGGFAFCALSGNCDSLRTAIYTANACGAGGEPQVIRLPQGAIYAISDKMTEVETRTNPLSTLQREEIRVGPTGLPLIKANITIEGEGATIQRAERAPHLRFFQVLGGSSLTLEGLTLRDGGSTRMGGSIFNEGALILHEDEFYENHASGNLGRGGAIYNEGILVVDQDTVFSGNIAHQASAIYNDGTAEINDTIFSENGSGTDHHIIRTSRDSVTELNRATFTKNTIETGTIFNLGSLLVSGSTFTENRSLNAASIIQQAGSAAIRNSTFYDERGRSVSNISCDDLASLSLVDVTIFGNHTEFDTGAAIRIGIDCTFDISNTIIAGNSSANCLTANPPIVRGENLSSDDSCGGFSIMAGPELGPLQDNGGPTMTLLPSEGSPAVDAGGTTCHSEDQRGESRPVDGNGDGTAECDIGAVERGS